MIFLFESLGGGAGGVKVPAVNQLVMFLASAELRIIFCCPDFLW